MTNSKQIIESLVKNDLYEAQKLIKEDLVKRMGNALEEKLVEYAPTIFNESKKGSKPDFLDLDKDGDKKEPMKKAAKEAKNESFESFENELKSLVEEIEQETGEELTEEEIMELANELFDVISEEQDQEDEDDDEDEDDGENQSVATKIAGFDPRRTSGSY